MPPPPAQTSGAPTQPSAAATGQADPRAVGRAQITYPRGGVTIPGVYVTAGEVPVRLGQFGPAPRAGRLCSTVVVICAAGFARPAGAVGADAFCAAGLKRAC